MSALDLDDDDLPPSPRIEAAIRALDLEHDLTGEIRALLLTTLRESLVAQGNDAAMVDLFLEAVFTTGGRQ